MTRARKDATTARDPAPSYTGLQNLGNSCYLASVVQVLFSLPPFIEAYFENGPRILEAAPADPSADLTVQLAKMATGLLSGRYSQCVPRALRPTDVGASIRSGLTWARAPNGAGPGRVPADPTASARTRGASPRDRSRRSSARATRSSRRCASRTVSPRTRLLRVVGCECARPSSPPTGILALASVRTFPAVEFFQYLMTSIERSERAAGRAARDPSNVFKFRLQERIQCGVSGQVAYRNHTDSFLDVPIPLERASNLAQVADYEVSGRVASRRCAPAPA